jgi:hypothetical protein
MKADRHVRQQRRAPSDLDAGYPSCTVVSIAISVTAGGGRTSAVASVVPDLGSGPWGLRQHDAQPTRTGSNAEVKGDLHSLGPPLATGERLPALAAHTGTIGRR